MEAVSPQCSNPTASTDRARNTFSCQASRRCLDRYPAFCRNWSQHHACTLPFLARAMPLSSVRTEKNCPLTRIGVKGTELQILGVWSGTGKMMEVFHSLEKNIVQEQVEQTCDLWAMDLNTRAFRQSRVVWRDLFPERHCYPIIIQSSNLITWPYPGLVCECPDYMNPKLHPALARPQSSSLPLCLPLCCLPLSWQQSHVYSTFSLSLEIWGQGFKIHDSRVLRSVPRRLKVNALDNRSPIVLLERCFAVDWPTIIVAQIIISVALFHSKLHWL